MSIEVNHRNRRRRPDSSSSPLRNHDNHPTRAYDRALLSDQVTKISDTECMLTTFLHTEYAGWDTASGIMFTVETQSEDIELLTIEFQTYEDYDAGSNTQVYYREGTFSGVTNDPSEWKMIADTSAEFIRPPSALEETAMGAILPANNFEPVVFEAGQIYSIYISTPFQQAATTQEEKTFLKVNPVDKLIGDLSTENGSLKVMTGVSLDGAPFPSTFKKAAEFNGVLHYQISQTCSDRSMLATTSIDLLYSLNGRPTQDVIRSLTNAVNDCLLELLWTNDNLELYSDEYMLEIEGMVSNILERNGKKCTTNYSDCGLVSITVMLKHSRALDPGLLETEILVNSRDELDTVVASIMAPVATKYTGERLSQGEFVITLIGVPDSEEMNDIQRTYFEEVTKNFLQKQTESKIFTIVANEEVPVVEAPDEAQGQRKKNRGLVSLFKLLPTLSSKGPMLRRMLENSENGEIRIITEIEAEGSMQEMTSLVLEGIGNNIDEYMNQLITQQMRPGEINEQDYGQFFAELTNVKVKPQTYGSPTKVGESGDSTTNASGNEANPSDDTGRGFPWVILCIALIVFSLFWIFYRIYKDCFYAPRHEPVRLNRNKVANSRLRRMLSWRSEKPSDSDSTPSQEDSSDEDRRPTRESRSLSESLKRQGPPNRGISLFVPRTSSQFPPKRSLSLHQSSVMGTQALANKPRSLHEPLTHTRKAPTNPRKPLPEPTRTRREDFLERPRSLHDERNMMIKRAPPKRTKSLNEYETATRKLPTSRAKSVYEAAAIKKTPPNRSNSLDKPMKVAGQGLPKKPRSLHDITTTKRVLPKRSKSFEDPILKGRGRNLPGTPRSLREPTSIKKTPPNRSNSFDKPMKVAGQGLPKKPRSLHDITTTKRVLPKRSKSFEDPILKGRGRNLPGTLRSLREPTSIKETLPKKSKSLYDHNQETKKAGTESESSEDEPSFHDDSESESFGIRGGESSSEEVSLASDGSAWDETTLEVSLGGSHYDSDSDDTTRSEKRSVTSCTSNLSDDVDIFKHRIGLQNRPIAKQKIRRYSTDSNSTKNSLEGTAIVVPKVKKHPPMKKNVPSSHGSIASASNHSIRSCDTAKQSVPKRRQTPSRSKSLPMESMGKFQLKSKKLKNDVGERRGSISSMDSSKTFGSNYSSKAPLRFKGIPSKKKKINQDTFETRSIKSAGDTSSLGWDHNFPSKLPKKIYPKLPPKKLGVKRHNSMPVQYKIRQNELDTRSSDSMDGIKKISGMSIPKKKVLNNDSESSMKKSAKINLPKKKIGNSSTHSDSKAALPAPKKRGIQASKSLPLEKKKPTQQPRDVMWCEMLHDSDLESDSDSEDSFSVLEMGPDDRSEVAASTNVSSVKKKGVKKFTPSNKSTKPSEPIGKLGQSIFEGAHRKNLEDSGWTWDSPNGK